MDKIFIRYFKTNFGKYPYWIWFYKLDKSDQVIITTRINRVRLGNFGDCEFVRDNIYDLRIHHGPGYRIYFTKINNKEILVLFAGDKKSQSKDIEKSIKYLNEFDED